MCVGCWRVFGLWGGCWMCCWLLMERSAGLTRRPVCWPSPRGPGRWALLLSGQVCKFDFASSEVTFAFSYEVRGLPFSKERSLIRPAEERHYFFLKGECMRLNRLGVASASTPWLNGCISSLGMVNLCSMSLLHLVEVVWPQLVWTFPRNSRGLAIRAPRVLEKFSRLW